MSERAKKAAGTQYVPDTEDWWGDFDLRVPPPPLRVYEGRPRPARRRGMSPLSRALRLLTCVMLVVGLCIQLYRVQLMMSQNNQIQSAQLAIEKGSSSLSDLILRAEVYRDAQRVQKEASARHFITPDASQTYVIALSSAYEWVLTANAAAEGGAGIPTP